MLRAALILLTARLGSPALVGRVVVALLGLHPEVGDDLERICYRESRCQADVGVHIRDSYLSRGAWLGQVRLGHLNPECQPYADGMWATRGPHGLSASAHWSYLPPCYQPAVLDSPWVSAWVAARKHERVCGAGCDSARWCPEARSSRCRR